MRGGVQQLPVAVSVDSSAPSSEIDVLPPSDDSRVVCDGEEHASGEGARVLGDSEEGAAVLGVSQKGAYVLGTSVAGACKLGSLEEGACELGDEFIERVNTLSESEAVVDLGIVLLPNPSPSEEVRDMSEASSESLPSLITAGSVPSILTYKSFDTSSGDDSFMPRRRKKSVAYCDTNVDWEFLDDVSTSQNTEETEDTSVSIVEEEGLIPTPAFEGLDSAGSSLVESDASSVALAGTLVTSSSRRDSEKHKSASFCACGHFADHQRSGNW